MSIDTSSIIDESLPPDPSAMPTEPTPDPLAVEPPPPASELGTVVADSGISARTSGNVIEIRTPQFHFKNPA
jgi:hypothetical protein